MGMAMNDKFYRFSYKEVYSIYLENHKIIRRAPKHHLSLISRLRRAVLVRFLSRKNEQIKTIFYNTFFVSSKKVLQRKLLRFEGNFVSRLADGPRITAIA